MKKYLCLLTLVYVAQGSAELLTTEKGLDKIKTNLETAKKNKTEYDKNLELVKQNVMQVQKVKDATLQQKKMVTSEINKNTDSVKKVLTQEKDLNLFILKENEKLLTENNQLEQLQKMSDQIKKNQEQRKLIIADYQNQQNQLNQSKKAWKNREEQLRAQENKAAISLRSIASEEISWLGKKKKYENEIKRWSTETIKQQKIHDTYQVMAEKK